MIFKRLRPYVHGLWPRFIAALLCMSMVAAISTGVMWVMKFLVDTALTQKDTEALHTAIILVLSGFTLKALLWYSHTYLTAFISYSIGRRLRDHAYSHLYSLSMGFFDEKSSSNILSRLTNDVTTFQIALASGPTGIVRDGLTVIGLIGFIFYLHWKFALLCFIILPVAAGILTFLGKKSRRAGREGQARMADMYGIIQEGVSAMPIVKTFQNEKQEIQEFADENHRYFNAIMKLVRVEARSSPIMEVLGALVLALLLFIGGHDVLNGVWSLGSFMAFIGAAMSLYNPIKAFAQVNVKIQQGLAASERVFHLLDQKATVVDNPHAKAAPALHTSIEFKNVSFRYPTTDNVLNDIDLTINKGEIVALVGPSGSGKSTIAQLLLRFYDPTAGRLLFDGMDMNQLSVQSLRQQMAIVTQETHLFNDTVLKNIEYGKPGSTRDAVVDAAKAAYADDFICELPNGYDTVIGERGTRLSGGERQRLAIARALLKNPNILILDEATSALDVASEKIVQLALDRLLLGRTVLVIAHRLSTVQKANRIVVLKDGRIGEWGTHNELLEKQGLYKQFVELQRSF